MEARFLARMSNGQRLNIAKLMEEHDELRDENAMLRKAYTDSVASYESVMPKFREDVTRLQAENAMLRNELGNAAKTSQHTATWYKVVEALGDGWTRYGKTGEDSAVNLIRELKRKAAHWDAVVANARYSTS